MLSLILRGGQIVDGTGAPPRRADVGIAGDRIVAVGDLATDDAAQIVDVTGRFVTPGWIDIHTHNDETVFIDPGMQSKVHQGVTTVVTGNCGESAAPVRGAAYDNLKMQAAQYGSIPLTWRSTDEFLTAVEHLGLATNYLTLVGYGTLRANVIGYEMRAPEPAELAELERLVAQCMEQGAWGLSTGLIYPPSSYADLDELVAVSRVAARYDGLYASHIRNEGDRLLEAVDEALTIGRQAGIRVQLSHHKAVEKRNWGKVNATLARIAQARADGFRVCADQYPYTASSTGLSTVLPGWAHEGGTARLVERLRDPDTRGRIIADSRAARPGWEDSTLESVWHHIIAVGVESDRALQGQSIWEIAAARHQDPVETSCDLLVENQGTVHMVNFAMCEQDVQTVIRTEWVFVGSDAIASAPAGPLAEIRCHPRTYGTFPRVLGRYVRELGVLTWEQAIAKMTDGPAQMLGLKQRGRLQAGYFADVVVFDPERILDTATFAEPHQFPTGIDHVLVNGTPVVNGNGATGARPGQVLRHGA